MDDALIPVVNRFQTFAQASEGEYQRARFSGIEHVARCWLLLKSDTTLDLLL